MGKRGATQATVPKAKAQKKVAFQEEVVEERHEECSPVAELLAMAEDIPESCREMLGAMAPHSLRTPFGERHTFQEQMIDVLSSVVAGIEEKRKASVATIEAQIAEAAAEREGASKALEAATEKEASEISSRDAKVLANAEAELAAAAASGALVAAQEKVKSFESEQKATAEEKEHYEKLAGEKMEQLKVGAFPGKQWRDRDRIIGEMTKALEALCPQEVSLQGAFGVAMKAKPDQRGRFAEKAVEFAEALLAKHIAALAETLASGEAEAAARAQAVVAADEALKAANEKLGQSQDEFIAAENSLLETTEAKNAAQQVLDDFGPKTAELAAGLAEARERLEGVQALVAKFEALRTTAAAAEEKQEPAMAVEEKLEEPATAVEEKLEEPDPAMAVEEPAMVAAC